MYECWSNRGCSDNRLIFLLIDDLSELPENLNNNSVIQQFHYPDNST